jgi:hypothetical protein
MFPGQPASLQIGKSFFVFMLLVLGSALLATLLHFGTLSLRTSREGLGPIDHGERAARVAPN